MIRVVVVDDERPARQLLRDLLAADPELTIVGEAADGADAIDVIEREQPELVCLDVEMPELNGFEVLAALPEGHLPLVIFATAFDHYAVRAFEEHAVDYLLKPNSRRRLATALERAKQRLRSGVSHQEELTRLVQEQRPVHPNRLAVKVGATTRIVPVAAIDWIEAAGNYVTLFAANEQYLVRTSMNEMESKLAPKTFARIHRSIIVNVSRIVELRPAAHRGDATVVLQSGRELPLSRSFRSRLAGLVAEV